MYISLIFYLLNLPSTFQAFFPICFVYFTVFSLLVLTYSSLMLSSVHFVSFSMDFSLILHFLYFPSIFQLFSLKEACVSFNFQFSYFSYTKDKFLNFQNSHKFLISFLFHQPFTQKEAQVSSSPCSSHFPFFRLFLTICFFKLSSITSTQPPLISNAMAKQFVAKPFNKIQTFLYIPCKYQVFFSSETH